MSETKHPIDRYGTLEASLSELTPDTPEHDAVLERMDVVWREVSEVRAERDRLRAELDGSQLRTEEQRKRADEAAERARLSEARELEHLQAHNRHCGEVERDRDEAMARSNGHFRDAVRFAQESERLRAANADLVALLDALLAALDENDNAEDDGREEERSRAITAAMDAARAHLGRGAAASFAADFDEHQPELRSEGTITMALREVAPPEPQWEESLRAESLHRPDCDPATCTLSSGDRSADCARRRDWGVGTVLEGDEGYGPCRIEITALTEETLLARCDSGEGPWTLSCRCWGEVAKEADDAR